MSKTFGKGMRVRLKALIAGGEIIRCSLCGNPIDSPELLSLDHIIPKSKGGKNYSYNLQPTHHRCNRKKADTLPDLADKTPEGKKAALAYLERNKI